MKGKIEKGSLAKAALSRMQCLGRPLSKLPGRGNLYEFADGKTVRLRTCQRHVLLVNAARPDSDAKLDIEGTDLLLVAMPAKERTEGKILTYLIPTSEAVAEMRHAHEKWLATSPATEGQNTAWTLAFKEMTAHDNYAVKWKKYRLDCRSA
jgi:hypothetical protein